MVIFIALMKHIFEVTIYFIPITINLSKVIMMKIVKRMRNIIHLIKKTADKFECYQEKNDRQTYLTNNKS